MTDTTRPLSELPMTEEGIKRFEVELTNPDELGLTDSRIPALCEMALTAIKLTARLNQPVPLSEWQEPLWVLCRVD